MAKIVYACVRNMQHMPVIKQRILSIIKKLVPDNIPSAECKIEEHGNIVYGISTYNKGIKEKNGSVCLGVVFDEDEYWDNPKEISPEGSYAIFRCDKDFVEAITDAACNRCIWFYKDDNIFVAGTSQRAVSVVAGKFEFDKTVLPWILSSGCLGPSLSWNKYLRLVPADGSLLLNRKTWEITIKSSPANFASSHLNDKALTQHFENELKNCFGKMKLDLSSWVLPLSGGFDSRGIACLLKATGNDISKLHTITWGLKSSLNEKKTDGYLGVETAKALGMSNQFWETDDMSDDTEKVFQRFIQCSEGRIDHVSGYMDGMSIWKNIFETGYYGVLRGDETFGAPYSPNYERSLHLNQLKLCKHFCDLENYEEYGFEKQELPENLKEIKGESGDLSRDRLYQEFRIPTIMNALSDIKYAYTEVANPFLTKQLLYLSRTIPDHLRVDKVLFTQIIKSFSPDVPFTPAKATDKLENILKSPAAIKLYKKEINADYIRDVFPEVFLQKVANKLEGPLKIVNKTFFDRFKIKIRDAMPVWLKEKLRTSIPKPSIDSGVLGFRVYMTGKVYRMFSEDMKNADL